MKILLSGASGLVGTELKKALKGLGYQVFTLARKENSLKENEIFWNPEKGVIDFSSLEGFEAVVHLAGENIANGLWTEKRKQKILRSRVDGTTTLVQALVKLKSPPKTLISASAIGIYGNRTFEVCDENSPKGTGFLADVCQQWEAASLLANKAGMRVVNLRTGIVLSEKGGALSKMLIPFKFCLGGKLGSGKQFMSWIAIDDLIAIILYALKNPEVNGPINAVSPNPVKNEVFTVILGEVLHRPTFFSVPSFVLRVLLGKELADSVLLGGVSVSPKKLLNLGYQFKYPDLKQALEHIINK